MKSYDYKHRVGIQEISWEGFFKLAKKLAELLAAEELDIIVGIARAGLIPATTVSCMLGKEFYPIRLTRRFEDKVVSDTPLWKTPLPENVLQNKTVAIIDEIADSGRTLSIVAEEVHKFGAKKVITAGLICHSWANPRPDIVVFESDELIIFPWNYYVYDDGRWEVHPEYQKAIEEQRFRR